ncbi:SAM-dependent methyltransferase [Streptomyces sp. NPDC005336]|uniref:SAM-dependent methyltransferase n=1 Tax=Streptomyces sp. NPDC005336 TaxID=3157035 RepID=UPI0033B378C2
MTDRRISAEEIDTSRPHPARMYDYYLGGKDNYEIDRLAAERIIRESPDILDSARANRDFLLRAVRTVVANGVRQIIDIGTGIPTSPNTHEVAREIAPDTRVVYIDNDPIVAAHADAQLTNAPGTGFAFADARKPAEIVDHPVVHELVDFGRPVAVLLVAVLHFVADEEDPAGVVAVLTGPMAPGSHLVISHGTADFHGHQQVVDEVYRQSTARLRLRRHDEVLPFFDGFGLLDPGLVQVPLWRPDGPAPDAAAPGAPLGVYGGVGRRS